MEGKTTEDIVKFQEKCRDELWERLERFGERLDEAREELHEAIYGPKED